MAKPSTKKPAGDVTAAQASWSGRDWFLGLILFLTVILAYQPVWYAGFVWDDAAHVTANPCIVGPLGLKEIWTTQAASICPLVLTTFWVEHALWGLKPLPYHLVTVFMQGGCAILLWQVLRRLQLPGAWLGAALWALHPLQVESVAWITEMKNTQSGLFYLLAILFYLKWLEKRDSRDWNYALTVLCAALAMASKTSTVVLPVVLALAAWWREGRWNWRNLTRLAPILTMSVVASALTLWSHPSQTAVMAESSGAGSWPERVARSGDVIWFYLGKLVWPHPLIAVYPRWQIDAGRWISYLPLLAVIGILFILWLKRESWGRPYFFALSYFLVVLSPFLGLIDQSFWRFSFVEDHLLYLAGMGPLALAGAGLAQLWHVAVPGKRWVPASFCAGLLVLLGTLSWQRARIFRNEETLWTDTLAKNPDCWLARNNLGVAFFQMGRTTDAIAQYEKALQIKPGYAEADKNLGVAYFQTGQVDKAIEMYQDALKIDPRDAEAYNKRAMAYARKGQADKAIADCQKALEIRPGYVEAYNNLGIVLFQSGQTGEAIAQYQKALVIDPADAEAHNNLAGALFNFGRTDEAIEEYQKALALQPDYAEAYKNLGISLAKMGRTDEAIAEYQKALAINPGYAEAYNNLGVAYFHKGQLGKAIVLFQKAVRLQPDYTNAQTNLAQAMAVLRQTGGSK